MARAHAAGYKASDNAEIVAVVDNLLFYNDSTRMLFGDVKASVQSRVDEFKDP